ncbi:SLC13 family permease [Saccharibacillus sp. CPCC 101409]|uniref:SLC13 family permease n=1 Tax=Saccharibacillus sp. CPCC 101409 TaxID=3058041 RepID=UPI002671CF96|nr:SLC13 family permease [Saccharibacillus sp. CPCC 101409]MDO3409002.1 SLC13 family permease [Saccharibacillus sp. CPCC 101409]
MISEIDTAFWPVYTAAAVFGIAYVLVVTEKINGGLAAWLGALLLLVLGIVDWNAALTHHIYLNALLLLAGMMVTAAAVDRSGIVQFAVLHTVRAVRGSAGAMLALLTLTAALASALLGSGPALLLLAPLILNIGRTLKAGPVPFLIMSVIACNLGGMTTLAGSVPNIMIGSAADMDTRDFIARLLPPALLLLVVHLLLLLLIFRKELRSSAERRAELLRLEAALPNRRRALLSLGMLALLTAGLLGHEALHMSSGAVAAAAAVLMLAVNARTSEDAAGIREHIDFKTLAVLAGFYVLAAGLVETGIIGEIAARLLELTNENKVGTSLVLFAVSGLLSAVLDPVPLTAAAVPLIQTIGLQMEVIHPADLNELWWALALGAGIGSSGTLAGSVAGVLAAGLAQREGYRFSYLSYLAVAFPLTLLALAAGGWYLYTHIL